LSIHRHSIGTEKESSLHRKLKLQYTGYGGRIEARTGDFVADGISETGEIIEVQTGSFGPLKAKVEDFIARGKVRIIYPVAIVKYIEVFDKDKKSLVYRRKSPLKGSPWNLFDALLYAPELPLLRGVSIEIALVNIAEKRSQDGRGSWRRKGVSIFDRDLETWHESIRLEKKADYLRFVPFKKNELFTSSQLAERAGINTALAGKTLYVLTKLAIVKRTGKKGNSWLYKVTKK